MLPVSKFITYLNDDLIRAWPESARELVQFTKSLPERDMMFPLLACEAGGGEAEKAIPVSIAWSALHWGVVLLDKVIDHDELARFDTYEEVAALSSGPIFAAYLCLGKLEDPLVIHRAATELFRGFYQCAHGQYLDLMQARETMHPEQALKEYWRTTILKSGSVYQTGLAAGGAVATDKEAWMAALRDYGRAFGVIKQLMDDCNDVLSPPDLVDEHNPHYEITLPILLYNLTERGQPPIPAEREAIYQLLDKARVPETIGAILYEWQNRAINALEPLPPSQAKEKLADYATDLILPQEFLANLESG